MKSKALRIFSMIKLLENSKASFALSLLHPIIILLNIISNIAIMINSSINLSTMIAIQNISRAGLFMTEQMDDCTAVNACCNYEDQFQAILISYGVCYTLLWIVFILSCFINLLCFYRQKLYQQFTKQVKRDRNFDRASFISLLQPTLLDSIPMTSLALILFYLECRPVYKDCFLCYHDQTATTVCTNQLLSSSDGGVFSFRLVITTIGAILCSLFVTVTVFSNEKQIAAIYFGITRKNFRFYALPLLLLTIGLVYLILSLIFYPASIIATIFPLRYLTVIDRFFLVMGITALIAIPLMLILFAVMVSVEFPHSKIFRQIAAVRLFVDLCTAFFLSHLYCIAFILFQIKVYRRYTYPIVTKRPRSTNDQGVKHIAEETL